MLFEVFEDRGLSQFSYAVGCEAAEKIAIVDPRRDVDIYLDFAHERSLRISHVVETHIHADYASGAHELAMRSGASVCVSSHDKDEQYEVAFPHRDLKDGDELRLGSVRLEAIHTPGHTPEHLSFLVFDEHRSKDLPMLALTGDFLFVGSVGRPDLLGEDAKMKLAEQMYESIHEKLAGLPDSLEIHPAHGAGSMCGAGMSGRSQSTLGFERATNPYLRTDLTKDQFVDRILSSVPPFPDYYRRMKRVNSEGAAILVDLPGRRAIPLDEFKEKVEDGEHVVVDTRDQFSFGGGHIPGSYGIGAGRKLSTWASWVVPYDTPLLLVLEREQDLDDVARSLVRVGLDDIEGYLKGGATTWTTSGFDVATLPQISVKELANRIQSGDAPDILDVRTDDEWEAGHIAGAQHIMGGFIPKSADQIQRRSSQLAIVCGSGYRSTVAASVLRRLGIEGVVNVSGGMQAWRRAGYDLE